MIRVVDKLREHQSPTPSKWREKAEYRRATKSGFAVHSRLL